MTNNDTISNIIEAQFNNNNTIDNIFLKFEDLVLKSFDLVGYRVFLEEKVENKAESLLKYTNSTSKSSLILKAKQELTQYNQILLDFYDTDNNLILDTLSTLCRLTLKTNGNIPLQALVANHKLVTKYSSISIGFIAMHLPSSLFKSTLRSNSSTGVRETVITYKHTIPSEFKDMILIYNSNLPTKDITDIRGFTEDKYHIGMSTKLSTIRKSALTILHSIPFTLIKLTDLEIGMLLYELHGKDDSISLEHSNQCRVWFYTYKYLQDKDFYFNYKVASNGLRVYNNNSFHPNTNKIFRKMFILSSKYTISPTDKNYIKGIISTIKPSNSDYSMKYYLRHINRQLLTCKLNVLINLDAVNQGTQISGVSISSPSLASYGGISLTLLKASEVMADNLNSSLQWWFERTTEFMLLDDRQTYSINSTVADITPKVDYDDDVVILIHHGYNRVGKRFYMPSIIKLDLSNAKQATTIRDILTKKLESIFNKDNSKYLLMTVGYNKSDYANCEGDWELREQIKHLKISKAKDKAKGKDIKKVRDWKDIINNTPTNRIPLKYIMMLEGINIQDTQIKQYIYRGAVNAVSPLLFKLRDKFSEVYDGMETEDRLEFTTIDGMQQIIPKYKQVSTKTIIPLLNGKSKQVTTYHYEMTCEDEGRLRASPLHIQGLDSYGACYMINNSNAVISNHDSFYIPFTKDAIDNAKHVYKEFLCELLDYRPYNKAHNQINGERFNYRNIHMEDLLTREDIMDSEYPLELEI